MAFFVRKMPTFRSKHIKVASGTARLRGLQTVVRPDVHSPGGGRSTVAARVAVDDVHESSARAVKAVLNRKGAFEECPRWVQAGDSIKTIFCHALL